VRDLWELSKRKSRKAKKKAEKEKTEKEKTEAEGGSGGARKGEDGE